MNWICIIAQIIKSAMKAVLTTIMPAVGLSALTTTDHLGQA